MSRIPVQTVVSIVLRFAQRLSQSCRLAMLLTGVISGFYLLVFFAQFFVTFGMSLPAVSAVPIVLAIAIGSGLRAARMPVREQTPTNGHIRAVAITHFALALWAVAFSWLLEFASSVVGRIPAESLANRWLQSAVFLVVALVLLLPAIVWIAAIPVSLIRHWQFRDRVRLPVSTSGERLSHQSLSIASFLFGTAIGMLLAVLVVAPNVGVQFTGSLVAVVSVVIAFLAMLKSFFMRRQEERAEATHAGEPAITDDSEPAMPWRFEYFDLVAVFACLGLLCAALERFSQQLMQTSVWTIVAEWGVVLTAIAVGIVFHSRKRAESAANEDGTNMPSFALGLFASLYSIALIAAFPLFVFFALTINSSISELWLSVAARTALVASIWLPVGFAVGHSASTACSALSRGSHHSWMHPLSVAPLVTALTYLAARWVVIPELGIAMTVNTAAWGLAATALWQWIRERTWARRGTTWIGAAVVVAVIAAAPLWRGMYDPGLSAKLLFDTNAFVAYRNGVDFDAIPVLDEGRCVAIRETERGTMTFFHYRGSQIQIRESGTPKGILSANPRICPEYSAEVIHAVLPMSTAETPHRVLILGFGSGTPLATCLSFPVQHVTCVEPDARFLVAARQTIATRNRVNVFADERVTFLSTDPAVVLRTQRIRYDVILENSGAPSSAQSAASMTQEYYRRVADHLEMNGVFCQRFDFADYGPPAIKCVVRTLQSVFSQVVAVETAPGSLALLASNSQQSLINDTLAARLQVPHVRQVLSHVGWDWSVFLKLSVWPDATLAEMAKSDENEINTETNGLLAMRLPLDMMRWGPKYRDTRQLLDRMSHHVVQLLGDAATERETKRRIAEVAMQRELMNGYPDRFWAYRQKAKRQVTKNPRSQIVQVSGQLPRRKFHAEDKRRMAYFKALGEAVNQDHPSRASLDELASFEFPYDPLISFFLHEEFAELSQRANARDVQSELVHRLHAIYFSSVTDRSIRNVINALELLNEHDEAVTSASERWGHINALLQTMNVRWKRRMAARQESSRVVMNDIEKSLSVADRSMKLLEELAVQIGVEPDAVERRQIILERELLRPLRTYRGKVLPKYQKAEERLRELNDDTRDVQPTPAR